MHKHRFSVVVLLLIASTVAAGEESNRMVCTRAHRDAEWTCMKSDQECVGDVSQYYYLGSSCGLDDLCKAWGEVKKDKQRGKVAPQKQCMEWLY